jgi:hypothetical protein
MAVNELKLYLTEHVQAGRCGIDENHSALNGKIQQKQMLR